ncbi:Crp/Fnr family transcriptional regulator [Paenibacillus contaminans]|uniref:Crp/Fnr family transcriptional regulator n=1 Tax=Paenibacillus contaminans TaxID=450362 RepID=A0A329MHU6_9BACL|nr:Crp/Fnr family transcriptional regulator [Paenibacillus contaminans]RAV19409.1 Crp/Fnr family transcriptional regulator [Paenibacillus contaminans]
MKSILLKYLARYTTLTAAEQQAIVDDIHVQAYKKGTLLLRQGDVPDKCYFVLKGCVRQYSIDEAGKEVTSNFYTEEQAVSIFNHHKQNRSSAYSLTCLEDCVLVVGDLEGEKDMLQKYSQLETMIRWMVEENLGEVQDEKTSFIASAPEERYKALLRKRPGLADRVPQHQLASYLGITPESLSRIKKRISKDDF